VGNSFTSYNGGINKQLEGTMPLTQTALVDLVFRTIGMERQGKRSRKEWKTMTTLI